MAGVHLPKTVTAIVCGMLLIAARCNVSGAPVNNGDGDTGGVAKNQAEAPFNNNKGDDSSLSCAAPAVAATKGHCMCPPNTKCSGSSKCRGGVSASTKQSVSGYLQHCTDCKCIAVTPTTVGEGADHDTSNGEEEPADIVKAPAARANTADTTPRPPRVLVMTVATHRYVVMHKTIHKRITCVPCAVLSLL